MGAPTQLSLLARLAHVAAGLFILVLLGPPSLFLTEAVVQDARWLSMLLAPLFIALTAFGLCNMFIGVGLIRRTTLRTSMTSAIAFGAVCLGASYPFSEIHGSLTEWALTSDHTRYAAGFSEASFSKICAGMTESDVCSLLGEPFSSGEDNHPVCAIPSRGQQSGIGATSIWLYSYFDGTYPHRGFRGRGRAYHNVIFTDGLVVGTHRYYDPDW